MAGKLSTETEPLTATEELVILTSCVAGKLLTATEPPKVNEPPTLTLPSPFKGPTIETFDEGPEPPLTYVVEDL